MLEAIGLPIPKHLNVHGYWGLGGGKMSKSVGNVVEALALTEKYGNDAFRYFVMREMTFGLDANFSEEAFIARLNADLANDLGNLVSRATTLIAGFQGGLVPGRGPITAAERGVSAAWGKTLDGVAEAMEGFAFQRALGAIWEFVATLNRYIDTEQPWALAKDPARAPQLRSVLATLAGALRCLGGILSPFLPGAAGKIREALGQTAEPRLEQIKNVGDGSYFSAPIQKLTALFPRVDETKFGLAQAAPATHAASDASRVTIDDFSKIDLRVAEIVAAERVPKSKKLLQLTVKVGLEERTMVAGIAEHYEPTALVGRKVVIVANLEPATLMGVRSDGMVLAASEGGTLSLLTLDRDLPAGSRVK
jgi:methionyl-tRNA synthetase